MELDILDVLDDDTGGIPQIDTRFSSSLNDFFEQYWRTQQQTLSGESSILPPPEIVHRRSPRIGSNIAISEPKSSGLSCESCNAEIGLQHVMAILPVKCATKSFVPVQILLDVYVSHEYSRRQRFLGVSKTLP